MAGPGAFEDNWKAVAAGASLPCSQPFAALPVHLQSAEEAFVSVFKNAGDVLPKRDSVDNGDVSDAKNGSGKIINNENDVGEWPIYASSQPQPNHANDGIADDWKKAGDCRWMMPSLANQVTPTGYTELEMFLNSLMPDEVMN
jgi:hypothetical protein